MSKYFSSTPRMPTSSWGPLSALISAITSVAACSISWAAGPSAACAGSATAAAAARHRKTRREANITGSLLKAVKRSRVLAQQRDLVALLQLRPRPRLVALLPDEVRSLLGVCTLQG